MAPTPTAFWGQPTSTLDWCEINYEVSPFIAEFCKSYQKLFEENALINIYVGNTISNLGMIIPPLFGMYEVIRNGLERKFIWTLASIIGNKI
jgi:dihydroceramidase